MQLYKKVPDNIKAIIRARYKKNCFIDPCLIVASFSAILNDLISVDGCWELRANHKRRRSYEKASPGNNCYRVLQ